MINNRELQNIGNQFEILKDEIFPMRATWKTECPKIRLADGSFKDGAIIEQIFNCSIEPIRRGLNLSKLQQGLEESSSHALITLKQWAIKLEDTIAYRGNTYRVTYKFLDQFNVNYQEYLIQIHTLK